MCNSPPPSRKRFVAALHRDLSRLNPLQADTFHANLGAALKAGRRIARVELLVGLISDHTINKICAKARFTVEDTAKVACGWFVAR